MIAAQGCKRVLIGVVISLTAAACAYVDVDGVGLNADWSVQQELITIADGLDRAVDAKDWEQARAYFADEVRVDFSSIGGGPAAVIPADALIGAWRANLFDRKMSFHLRGNHGVMVEGETAQMVSHGYAWNKLPGLEGGALWEVWGVYDYAFILKDGDWLIAAFTFTALHQRGNPAVRVAQE